MITREILKLINHKLGSVIIYMVIIGLAFFVLAAAILFYPEILQYLFILGFFLISFLAFLTAIKINHIKQIFDKALLLLPKKRK
jgi:threonine/homoserine/homoserine lactone efflux protein